MSTTTVKPNHRSHSLLAADLIRAIYSHGGILSNRRMEDFNALIERIDKPLHEILAEFIVLDGDVLRGEVILNIQGQTVSSRQVLRSALRMIGVYVIKGLERMLELLDKHHNTVHVVFAEHSHMEDRLRKSIRLLPLLIEASNRWNVCVDSHAAQIAPLVQSLNARVADRELDKFGNIIDVSSVQKWAHYQQQLRK